VSVVDVVGHERDAARAPRTVIQYYPALEIIKVLVGAVPESERS